MQFKGSFAFDNLIKLLLTNSYSWCYTFIHVVNPNLLFTNELFCCDHHRYVVALYWHDLDAKKIRNKSVLLTSKYFTYSTPSMFELLRS